MALFFLSLLSLLVIWLLYPLTLSFLHALKPRNEKPVASPSSLSVTVIVAAHNEADNLGARIENIYAGDYPDQLIEVVIASDGSTDRTASVVQGIQKRFPAVKLIEIMPQQGRSNAHNHAVPKCSGDVLVFTDAETVFESNFFNKIVAPFANSDIGFVSGVLRYRNQKESAITESAGLYWRFEYLLRRLESQLSIYVFGSGACCAVHKDLYRDIPPTGDVDFTTPLDVALQGHRCVHVDDAVAYEVMPDTPEREFRARVRMTAKNLYGTVTRWGFKGLIHHPVYSLVIFFHKIGRWLTPFAMVGLFISSLFLLGSGIGYALFFAGQLLFYFIAVAGYFRLPVPLAGQIYSFCLANMGFLIGVLKAVSGRVPAAYKPLGRM